MIYTIGLDPGTISGWAFIAIDATAKVHVMAHGKTGIPGSKGVPTQRTTGGHIFQVLRQLQEVAPGAWPPVVVHERQFLPGKADSAHGSERDKAIGAMESQVRLGRWLGIAEAMGCPIFKHRDGKEGVPPGVWRADQWGSGRWTTKKAKRTALLRAKELWGLEIPRQYHHTAEAVFIGVYGGMKLRERAQLERQENKETRNEHKAN